MNTNTKHDVGKNASPVLSAASRGLLSYLGLFAFFCGSILSCDRTSPPPAREIVLYTSVDEPIARPIIEQFEKDTGVKVALVTDTEANKSVGLAEKLRAEKDRPRADVWWGNEPFHTIRLAEEGLLAMYSSESSDSIPAMYKDPNGRWAGNGLRARVLIFHRPSSGDSAAAARLESLGRLPAAMARPTAGTTAGHVAALYVHWGDARADEFFRALRAGGITLLGGNGPVARAVADGQFKIGLTDNDDVAHLEPRKEAVEWRLPDQDDEGTLMIPATVGLVAGRPESPDARRLVDFLLSPAVERMLIRASFAGWSVRGGTDQLRFMPVDYTEVARKMPEAVRRATAILEGREP